VSADHTTPSAPQTGAAPPARPEASSARLTATLAIAGGLAGFLLVLVYQWTQPRIRAHKAEVLRLAIEEVLGAPERYDTLALVAGKLVPEAEAGAAAGERVYLGYDAGGRAIGFAVPTEGSGYQDVVRVLFGYDPRSGQILGMKVLETKETPGLGDKIETDRAFVGQFAGAEAPLEGYKAGERGQDPHGVDMITGATISSRTVIRIINSALDRLGGAMASFPLAEGGR
jgi:electron transport complex protein RnfG